MFAPGLAFVTANCLLVRLPWTIDAALLSVALPVLLAGIKYRSGRILAGFVLGLLVTAMTIEEQQVLRVSETRDAVSLTGRVCSLPVVRFGVSQFFFCPGESAGGPSRYRISWYRPETAVVPGQVWRLTVKLGEPSGSLNFGLFDYEQWQFARRIHGRGYVRSSPSPVYLGIEGEHLDRLRYRLQQMMAHQLPGWELGTLLALSLGDTSRLLPDQWTTLNATGTTHLLIVSGLHTGLIAAFAFGLLRFSGLSIALVSLGTLLATGGYAFMAGWGLPVQRAFIMTAVVLFSLSAGRQIRLGSQFMVALVLVLAIDPLASLSNGFWLSFGAVFALLYGMMGHGTSNKGLRGWVIESVRAQWIVFIALMPVLAWVMQQLPTASFPINLVAIPWVGMLLVPLLLIGMILLWAVPPAGLMLLQVLSWQVSLLWRFLRAGADQMQSLPVSAIDAWVVAVAAIGVLIMLAPRGLVPRWPGLLCLVLLLKPAREVFPDLMSVIFMDVGQGLSVVIETPSSTLIYDTGPEFRDRFSAAKQILLPALRNAGRDRVDTLIISHSDNDHAGGREVILGNLPVGRVLEEGNCYSNWSVDGVEFKAFSAAVARNRERNDASCLLLVSADGLSLLLTGDIEEAAEYALLDQGLGRVDIMSSPHHGSDSSSTPALLNAIAPDVIVVSAGYRNRFGHPNERVLNRYRNRSIRVLNTADAGAVRILFRDGSYTITQARQQRPAIWRRTGEDRNQGGEPRGTGQR